MTNKNAISLILALVTLASAVINGMAGHYEAAAIDMVACALFWGQA